MVDVVWIFEECFENFFDYEFELNYIELFGYCVYYVEEGFLDG